NNKPYKQENINNINMLPGDPKGLPDDSLNSLYVVNQRNAYKLGVFIYFRMFPSDPSRSLDVFFLINCLKSGGKF
ncbi:MAG: hypothetical protein AABX54_01575, partial [Nanoarchaeota archaeon]